MKYVPDDQLETARRWFKRGYIVGMGVGAVSAAIMTVALRVML